MSHRSSRPGSAASRRSSLGERRGSVGERQGSVGERRGSGSEKETFLLELKAAYLTVFDDLHYNIRSKQELCKVLQQTGRNPIARMLNKYWTQRTEYLTFKDFCDICGKEPVTSEDDLLKAFRKIDVNGDGYVTNAELRRILTTRGEKMTKDEVQEIIDEVDENRDGKLNYREFIQMVMRTQEECRKLAMKHLEKKQNKVERSTAKEVEPSDKNSKDDSDSDEIVIGSVSHTQNQTGVKKDEESPAAVPQPQPRQRRRSRRNSIASSISGSRTSLRSLTLAKDLEDSDAATSSKIKQEIVSTTTKRVSDDEGDDDDDEIVIGVSKSSKPLGYKSSSPPIPTPRSSHSNKDFPERHADDSGSLSRGGKDRLEWSRPGLTAKHLALQKPKLLRDWRVVRSKGCFFLDDNGKVIGHQYTLKVSHDTRAWITIEPVSLKSGDLNSMCEKNGAPMDMMIFLLDSQSRLVAIADQHDQKGKSGISCDLEKGSYRIIAFTTGCRLRRRLPSSRQEKGVELLRKKDGKITFTKDYKNSLSDIFDLFDLNGDGLLSRDEFNLYNLGTSGQEVADPEWEVVEANVELKDGEITRDGFLRLNQMEAEENQDNVKELWLTLNSLGFNKSLVMDEASPFVVEVHVEKGNASLKVTKLDSAGKNFSNILIQHFMEKAETIKVKGGRDLYLHAKVKDTGATLLLENKSLTRAANVLVDCRESNNVISHHGNLCVKIEVPAKSSLVAHHLLPIKDSHHWTVVCRDSVD